MTRALYKDIGQKLKQAREAVGLTQAQVAAFLGTAREQVSYYETGAREVDLGTVLKLADLYGCTPAYFLEPSSPEPGPGPLAFRAAGIRDEDLPVIARVQRIVRNLYELDTILAEGGGEADAPKS